MSERGRLIRVALDCADATQRRLDADEPVYDHEGRQIPLSRVKGALTDGPYIEYETESQFQKRDEEEWERNDRGWYPSRCRLYSCHVVEVMEVYEDHA